jgi:hypothetical protein
MAVKLPSASCSSDSDAPRDLRWRDRDVRAPRDRYVQARGRTHVRSGTRPTARKRENGEDVENAATRKSLESSRLGTGEQRGAGNAGLELWQVEGIQQCSPKREELWTRILQDLSGNTSQRQEGGRVGHCTRCLPSSLPMHVAASQTRSPKAKTAVVHTGVLERILARSAANSCALLVLHSWRYNVGSQSPSSIQPRPISRNSAIFSRIVDALRGQSARPLRSALPTAIC